MAGSHVVVKFVKRGKKRGITVTEKLFWVDGCVHYLDTGDGFTGVKIC